MTITHVNTLDDAGGAGRAAFRLHTALKAEGHRSRMLVGWRGESSEDVDALMMGGPLWWKVARRAASVADRMTGLPYLLAAWPGRILNHAFIRSADVVHLHNVHGAYFPLSALPALCRLAPVVWTLHDMWAMTGKSAFSYDCERWRTGCGHCPVLSEYPRLAMDTTALLWRVKRAIYRRSDVMLVTPSRWLAGVVRQSPLLGSFDVHCISNGVDTRMFKPVPRAVARECLGLPPEREVVLFSSDGLTERRKGAAYLRPVLEQLRRAGGEGPLLVALGGGGVIPELDNLPHPIQYLGRIRSEHLLAACYSAADVFVLATLADNLPNVIVESMACGTPVVSFDVGGVPEVVRHMETGYLARYRDAADFAKGVQTLLDDEALRSRMGRRCREVVEAEYGLDLQAGRVLALYREVMRRRRAAPDGAP